MDASDASWSLGFRPTARMLRIGQVALDQFRMNESVVEHSRKATFCPSLRLENLRHAPPDFLQEQHRLTEVTEA